MSLHQQIWRELSAIDVSGHVEKKNNLDYLSWAFAIAKLSEHFPNHSYGFNETKYDDGTVMVECMLTIHHGEETAMRTMWLPVMDFRNKAIANPDAFAINTTRMRCLVKCLAMWGLGLNLYSKTELYDEPQAQAEPEKKGLIGQKKLLWQRYLIDVVDAIDREDGHALFELDQELQDDEPVYETLHRSLTTDQKKEINRLIHEANQQTES